MALLYSSQRLMLILSAWRQRLEEFCGSRLLHKEPLCTQWIRTRPRLETSRCSALPNVALANCNIAEWSYSSLSASPPRQPEPREEYFTSALIDILRLLRLALASFPPQWLSVCRLDVLVRAKCHLTIKLLHSGNQGVFLWLAFRGLLENSGRDTEERTDFFTLFQPVISPVITLANRDPCLLGVSITECFLWDKNLG